MKEKNLLKIALLCAVLGIVALFFVSENMEYEEIKINKITGTDMGKEVRVIGEVESLYDDEKLMIIDVGQRKIETVSVVLFKDRDVKIKEGDIVELIGVLDEYGGEPSIVANAVKVR